MGTTTDTVGERNVYKIRGALKSLRQSGESFPLTFLCFLTGALAITAIPPFNGFASKAALSYGLKGTWQGYLLYAASLGTTASFIKLSRIYFPEKGKVSVHIVPVEVPDIPFPADCPGDSGSVMPGHGNGGSHSLKRGYTPTRKWQQCQNPFHPYLFTSSNLLKTATVTGRRGPDLSS